MRPQQLRIVVKFWPKIVTNFFPSIQRTCEPCDLHTRISAFELEIFFAARTQLFWRRRVKFFASVIQGQGKGGNKSRLVAYELRRAAAWSVIVMATSFTCNSNNRRRQCQNMSQGRPSCAWSSLRYPTFPNYTPFSCAALRPRNPSPPYWLFTLLHFQFIQLYAINAPR